MASASACQVPILCAAATDDAGSIFSVLVVVFFLGVTFLSRAHEDSERGDWEPLVQPWHRRSAVQSVLMVQLPISGPPCFTRRTSISYQLNLAEALIGQGHMGQAYAYLINLWEREPENGTVRSRTGENRGAARRDRRLGPLLSQRGVCGMARRSRKGCAAMRGLELIELLLRIHATAQAQAELIASAENAGPEPAAQQRIGDLFLRAEDYEACSWCVHRRP